MQHSAQKGGQVGLLDAGAEFSGATAEILEALDQRDLKLVRVIGSAVGQAPLQQRPDALVGVELRRVAGEVLQAEPTMSSAEGPEGSAAVDGCGVEQDDHGARQVAKQESEEPHDVGLLDVVLVEPVDLPHSVTLRADRDGGDGRYLVASEAVPQPRGPAARSPRPD